jgi:methionyl-tRNA formyltransferase
MKKVLFIGNRVNALKAVLSSGNYNVEHYLVLKDSFAEKFVKEQGIKHTIFDKANKAEVYGYIKSADYDILISNGCPLKLPVGEVAGADKRLFINIHPSKLPELKGINPVNGIYMFGTPHMAATVHFMDSGIDTGNIIWQETVELTEDIDLGLAYFIAFELEGAAMKKAIKLLEDSGYEYKGIPQQGEGSYYTRKDEDMVLNFDEMDTDTLIKRIKAFNITSLGALHNSSEGSYKLYDPEKIVNPFLTALYKERKTGEILKEYDGRLLIKTKDGILKINKFKATETR